MINYYVVLEIANFSDEAIIKTAYRLLSKKYHPDVNKDPFAHDYFLKINEAYDFLMNANKRLLLNQFLKSIEDAQKVDTNQARNTQSSVAPNIHAFYCDRNSFTLNDTICLTWHVSNCKHVSINILGDVVNQGYQYYKINSFLEELKIVLTIIGVDDQIYTSEIVLKYYNENPAKKEFHKMLLKNPSTKEIHFKKEKFFHSHSRISRLTFINRFVLLTLILALSVFLFTKATYPHLLFIIICSLLLTIWVQIIKRLHDVERFRNKFWALLIPFYNIYVVIKLFRIESENTVNEYGVYPRQEKKRFFNWLIDHVKKIIEKLSIFEKMSIGLYILILLVNGYKMFKNFPEYNVTLTNNHIESHRATTNSSAQKEYFLEFNNAFWIEVTEYEFDDIIYKRKFNDFVMGINKENEVQYVKGINTENKTEKRINSGLSNNANPAIIILSLFFLGQVYTISNLRAPKEIIFAKGYSIFCLLAYLATLYLLIL
ncbi:DnaJ domain-containing protein [Flavobacterium sp. xlx-214]|uniref:DUF805 domain-containing protein n=1 Tax=unclassified Flavobacterium TaxID=196869 RepID=UPI0013D4051C|nr:MULTISPECIES: DUF805 domain-containing protein [unclassified Flavobacterium]MBA5793699.1 DnaJ domain-containing protein [Flavobacterium sp. xlx-221]QMI83279.1 DnaJ domain-containing protein [Flavobacterium sp. xlx-214]